MAPEAKIQIGETLAGRYQIKSKLGSGGMGTVYLAADLKMPGKHWAVKETLRYSRLPSGFEAEAAALARLDHPFLPKMVDFLPPNSFGNSYLIMDFVKGETLQEKFEREKVFPWKKAVKYATQICDLFDYLHGLEPKPIIYRDLKPTNIMIDEQDNVRLIDFGIARTHSRDQGADTLQLGTVGFAAPEQFNGGQSDARTDLYTLGALLFYLLSGGIFFSMEFTRSHPAWNRLPTETASVVHKLLRKNPDERHQSAIEAKQAFETLLFPIPETREWDQTAERNQVTANFPEARRLVLVGGLYPGAGATLVAAGLSQLLNRLNVTNTVMECPFGQPELFHLLNGEINAPSGFRFAPDELIAGKTVHTDHWQLGCTRWLPADPRGRHEDWKMEHWYQLLFLLKTQVVLVDIGSLWQHPQIIELCGIADDLIVVTGPNPVKLNAQTTQEHGVRLIRLQDQGHKVHWVANRDCGFAGRNEWLASCPDSRPVCLPEISFCDLINGLWHKKGLVSYLETDSDWLSALGPVAERIGGKASARDSRKSRGGLFNFRRKKAVSDWEFKG